MSVVLETMPLGFPWQTVDPFLFCVHHDDAYPNGNEQLGPQASLAGRNLGNDFTVKDGFRMYHGRVVPGFPSHPHRGFETVTLARSGYIDHSDSLGAAARFGRGDAQWLTAGGGIVHSEMFPLLDQNGPNRVELFQIWLNLPAQDKLVQPHFSMLWEGEIPRHVFTDADGRKTEVTTVAGELAGKAPPPPPPKSWASRPDTDVAIWTLRLEQGTSWTLPPAKHPDAIRVLYFFAGPSLLIGDRELSTHAAAVVRSDVEVTLQAGPGPVEVLMLQGRPIGEPVAQHGPFVMNSRAELQQAFADYQRTQFGGWPWPAADPVHGREAGRFAKHIDGRLEKIEDV
jgi:redox-sensitive bicupin YhaK (pirin superfamily)